MESLGGRSGIVLGAMGKSKSPTNSSGEHVQATRQFIRMYEQAARATRRNVDRLRD